MFDSVKEVLYKDISPVEVKNFLSMEIEIQQLNALLEKEIKIKEFLLQDVDVKKMVSLTSAQLSSNTSRSVVQPQDSGRRKTNDRREINSRRIDDRRTIFGRRKSDTTNEANRLPTYDLGLIETLKKHHRELLFIYKDMMSYAEKKKYNTVKSHLSIFSEQFTDYFHIADQQLYGYLKAYINLKKPEQKKAFSALSLEMKNLYLSIYYSLNQSPNVPLNNTTYNGFMNEFGLLEDQLKERFEREEKVLMKIYKESNESENISSPEVIA